MYPWGQMYPWLGTSDLDYVKNFALIQKRYLKIDALKFSMISYVFKV